jgi:hypothetical protein
MAELIYVSTLIGHLRTRLAKVRKNEGGYSTEAVIVTALLAGLAIIVVGIIAVKVTSKANNIQTG